MLELNWWLCLVILILANFRIAVLLADDTGPFGIFTKLRSFLERKSRTSPTVRKSKMDEGIECKRCNSIWGGVLLAAWAFLHETIPVGIMILGDAAIFTLALSGGAILLVRAFPAR